MTAIPKVNVVIIEFVLPPARSSRILTENQRKC
jgi:hypothetical protein